MSEFFNTHWIYQQSHIVPQPGAAMIGTEAPKAVVRSKLFPCPDLSETVQEDFGADSAHRQIRIASVINELGVER